MFLINNEIKELPLNVYSVSKKNRWALLPYKQNINLLDCIDLHELHKKYEGFTIFFKSKVIIFYVSEVGRKDKIYLSARIRSYFAFSFK